MAPSPKTAAIGPAVPSAPLLASLLQHLQPPMVMDGARAHPDADGAECWSAAAAAVAFVLHGHLRHPVPARPPLGAGPLLLRSMMS
jgi:hypothetical protein